MNVSRRNLLVGSGALAAASAVLPRPAWAPPPPPPLKGVYGVYFGGATRGEVLSTNLDFPQTGRYLFGHVKINAAFNAANTNYVVVDLGNPTTSGSIFQLKFATGTKRGKAGIYIGALGGGKAVAVISPAGSIPINTWVDIKFGIDTNLGVISATLDDGAIPGLTYVVGSGSNFDINFWNVGGSLPLYWDVGRTVFNTGGGWFVGNKQDLFVASTAAFVDPAAQAVKDAFTDATGGTPIYLPDDGGGVLPSGDDPQILLHGPTSYFWRNLAKTEFTWPAGQSTPGAFSVVGPPVTPSAIDAWGFVGV